MNGPWHDSVIERIETRTPRIKSFFFRRPWVAAHVAGQHLDVRLSAPDGYTAQRSYSIASAPASDALELIIERLDEGEVSSFFHEVARVGDTIELRGPLGGHFVWQPADGGPLLLVGGGSGVAPLMAMVRAWATHVTDAVAAPRVPLLLVVSARRNDELAFHDELLSLQAAQPDFHFIAVLTREAPTRPGDLARRLDGPAIAELLARWGHAPRHVFACGANGFVESVANGLLDAGVPAARIRTERYGGA